MEKIDRKFHNTKNIEEEEDLEKKGLVSKSESTGGGKENKNTKK